jgi:AcrR family transcriptional regulator
MEGAGMAQVNSPPVRRLARAERRQQILDAATRAFARTGFAATSLDDIGAEAGVSHVILYRHFDSKADLYRAVLDRACTRIADTVGTDDYDEESIPRLMRAASTDPDGFRLLFRHAAREPEFRDVVDTIRSASIGSTLANRTKAAPPTTSTVLSRRSSKQLRPSLVKSQHRIG